MQTNRIFWAVELLLMATPSLFPQFPIPVALLMYAAALVLLLLAGLDWLRARGWSMPQVSSILTLGRLSPVKSDLMTMLELRELAARRGWNMGSLHVLDFLRALDEAGKRGLLRFYGRWNADSTAENLLRNRARELVPEKEWANLKVSPVTTSRRPWYDKTRMGNAPTQIFILSQPTLNGGLERMLCSSKGKTRPKNHDLKEAMRRQAQPAASQGARSAQDADDGAVSYTITDTTIRQRRVGAITH